MEAGEFIPVAAEQGLVGKIDRWVVLNAMRAAATMNEPVKLVFNINGGSLADASLADWLLKAMRAAKMDGSRLTFQLTEGDATTYLKQAGVFAEKMKSAGCGISISRFGGGLDPFKLFQHIPATMVKFEGSFTQELSKAESRERFAEIIQQARDSGRRTLVGFVESAAQMQTLWSLGGVDYLQGYYLQAPMDRLETAETTEG